MKRTLMCLGLVFLLLVIVFVISIGIIAIKGNKLDKESKQYVDTAILCIVSDWNKEELIKRSSPELVATIKNDDLDELFKLFQKLGKLKGYKKPEGQANISFTTEHGKVISANYITSAEFETGSATIKINLIKHGKIWQILGFNVDSDVFLGVK